MNFTDEIKFDDKGLVPCIVQDKDTLQVLMMAYMNKESLNMTLECGYCVFYSRSRQQLWKKGETSGNFMEVVTLKYDCDADTLLAIVEPKGPACHTGETTCFYRTGVEFSQADNNEATVNVIDADHKEVILKHDYDVLVDRKINPKPDSYTNYLYEKGVDKICKKVGEESAEIIIAAKNNNGHELACEISDFLYHLMVLMVNQGVEWDDVFDELISRQGMKSQKLSKFREREAKKRK